MKSESSLCPGCDALCRLNPRSGTAQPDGVISREDATPSDSVCLEGRYRYSHRDNGASRKVTPMIRTESGGPLRSVPWDVAIQFCAERLLNIREQHGPDALMFTAPQHPVNCEVSYLIQRYARAVINTNNVDYSASASTVMCLEGTLSALGVGTLSNPINTITRSDYILLFGFSYVTMYSRYAETILLAKKKGATVIICDWRERPENTVSDIFVNVKPEGVGDFVNGLAYALQQIGGIAAETAEGHDITGCVQAALTPSHSPESTAARSGISAPLIRDLALQLSAAENPVVLWEPSFVPPTYDVRLVDAIANLTRLIKNAERCCGVAGPVNMPAGIAGASISGAMPDFFPGYQSVFHRTNREKFAHAWHIGVEALSVRRGKRLSELPALVRRGEIKACYLVGQQPWNTDDLNRQAEEEYHALDFLVVQDSALTLPIMKMADAFFPAQPWHQQTGVAIRSDGEMLIQTPATTGGDRGEARADWEIIAMMISASGGNETWDDVGDVWEEMRRLSPMLEASSCSCNDNSPQQYLNGHSGVSIKPFMPVNNGVVRKPSRRFMTGPYHNTCLRVQQSCEAWRKFEGAPGLLHINTVDALLLNVSSDHALHLSSEFGDTTAFAHINDDLPSGTLCLTCQAWSPGCSALTDRGIDNDLANTAIVREVIVQEMEGAKPHRGDANPSHKENRHHAWMPDSLNI